MGVNRGITHGGKNTGKGVLENRELRKIFGTKRKEKNSEIDSATIPLTLSGGRAKIPL
jgi:hypothetical protein